METVVRAFNRIMVVVVGALLLFTAIALTTNDTDEFAPVPSGGERTTYCLDDEFYIADGLCGSYDTLSDAPACETEDQTTDCFWDATTHGNGQGRSFAVIQGHTVYLDELEG